MATRMPSEAEYLAQERERAARLYGDDVRVEEDFSVVPGPSYYARQPDEAAKHLKRVPKLYKDIYKRATGGHRVSAVRAKCLDCCGWTRREITLCTALTCPLWPVRPYQVKQQREKKGQDSHQDEPEAL